MPWLFLLLVISCGTITKKNDVAIARSFNSTPKEVNKVEPIPEGISDPDTPVIISGKSVMAEEIQGESEAEQTVILKVAAAEEVSHSEDTKQPLNIFFVLDRSGSMNGVFNDIRTNINAFPPALRSEGFQLTFGLVDFNDIVSDPLPLIDDFPRFRDFLNRITILGTDYYPPEAALAAIQKAIVTIKESTQNRDTVTVLVVVTDAPGHYGGTYNVNNANTADCTIGKVKTDLEALNQYLHSNLKFFYSSSSQPYDTDASLFGIPFVFPDKCSGYNNSRNQMDDILNEIFTAMPQGQRGKAIAWPFTSQDLLNNLITYLRTFVQIKKICLDTSASVRDGDKEICKWAGNFPDIYTAHNASQPIEIACKSANSEQIAKLQAKTAKILMTRTCFAQRDLDAAVFTKPLNTKVVELEY